MDRTDVEKCTHQCDETQGINSTRALSAKIVFFGFKKIDNKRRRKQRGQTTFFFFFFHLRVHNQRVDYSGAYNWDNKRR